MATNTNYQTFLQGSKNILLIKDEVGKPKPITRALPAPSYTYGKQIIHDKQGVGALLTDWQVHRSSSVPKQDKDFQKLNALSVYEGVHTASGQSKFRKINEIHLQIHSTKRLTPKPSITFGTENRPSTPIKAVICNFYGEYAAEHLNTQIHQAKKPAFPRPRSTNGFEKRNSAIKKAQEPQTKSLFKLKKFENVPNKTKTRRPLQ